MDKYRLHFVFRPGFRWGVYLFAGFFAFMSVIKLYQEFSLLTVFILIFCLYAIFGWKIERYYRIRFNYKKHEHEDRESTVELSGEHVYLKSSISESKLDWSVMKNLIVTPKGLLAQVTNHQNLFWLPQYLFEGNDKRQRIIDLFQSKKIMINRLS